MALTKVKALLKRLPLENLNDPCVRKHAQDMMNAFVQGVRSDLARDEINGFLLGEFCPDEFFELWADACCVYSAVVDGEPYRAEFLLIPIIPGEDGGAPRWTDQAFIDGLLDLFGKKKPASIGVTLPFNRIYGQQDVMKFEPLDIQNLLRHILKGGRGWPENAPSLLFQGLTLSPGEKDPLYIPLVNIIHRDFARYNHLYDPNPEWLDTLSRYVAANPTAVDTAGQGDHVSPVSNARVLAPMSFAGCEAINVTALELTQDQIIEFASNYLMTDHENGTLFTAGIYYLEKTGEMSIGLKTSCCQTAMQVDLSPDYSAYKFIDRISRELKDLGYTVKTVMQGHHFIQVPGAAAASMALN